MSKSVSISKHLHEFIKAHKQDDETMDEPIRRLIGGPHSEAVAGILSEETADTMRKRRAEKEGISDFDQ